MPFMNQILVNEKIIVTPEIKRKKKFYKIEFVFSVFLLCILFSYYIYAEYDRNKSEEVSKEILQAISYHIDTTTIANKENEYIIVYLNSNESEREESEPEETTPTQEETASSSNESATPQIYTHEGTNYNTIATINIPKINVTYPILSETTDNLLKIAPCKFWGPNPNEVGNFCIVGHNYRNTKFFSKVPTLENGDVIELTDFNGRTITYSVYDKSTVEPTDRSCTSQLTNGKIEITLITCTNDSAARVVVKARAI